MMNQNQTKFHKKRIKALERMIKRYWKMADDTSPYEEASWEYSALASYWEDKLDELKDET